MANRATSAISSRRRPAWWAVAVLAGVALLLVPTLVPVAAAGHATADRLQKSAMTRVPYSSSVDRFSLSYLEWLPAKYNPTLSTPLVVFLHGLGAGTARVIGGIGGIAVPDTVIDNASSASMILISLNTRTASGFYANTPCGGPQEQDVLDAIAHEKALHRISSVYLLGFSMGTVGAYSIAGHHPGLVSGIGVVAGISDLFEQLGYAQQNHAFPTQIQADFCGKLPSKLNASVQREVAYLSVARFAPQNFSGIPIYAVAGAADASVPNNFAHWPYAETNSSFVNSTCVTSSRFGEPSNCTTTFWSLAKLSPSSFSFRFVWEAAGIHSVVALPAGDFFAFLKGTVKPAFLSAGFPPTKLTLLPPPP